jgi:hypothetical protein
LLVALLETFALRSDQLVTTIATNMFSLDELVLVRPYSHLVLKFDILPQVVGDILEFTFNLTCFEDAIVARLTITYLAKPFLVALDAVKSDHIFGSHELELLNFLILFFIFRLRLIKLDFSSRFSNFECDSVNNVAVM